MVDGLLFQSSSIFSVFEPLSFSDDRDARQSKRGKNLERGHSHAVAAGGGIGGGMPAEIRFRQATR